MAVWAVYPEFLKKGFHVFRTRADALWCAVGPEFKNDFSISGVGATPQNAAALLLGARRGIKSAKQRSISFADFTVHEDPIHVETIDLPIEEILKIMNGAPEKPRPSNPQPPTFGDERAAAIVKDAASGVPAVIMAEKHGTSRGRIYQIIREAKAAGELSEYSPVEHKAAKPAQCVNCGADLPSVWLPRARIFCSKRCKKAAYRKAKRERRDADKHSAHHPGVP